MEKNKVGFLSWAF